MSIFSSQKFEIKNGVLVKYNGKDETVTIPAGVTSIGYGVFMENKRLKSVIIPEGVKDIGNSAFLRSGLESVTLPKSLRVIETHGFGGCFSLKAVTLPDGLTTLKKYAFHYCSSLTSLRIPTSVTTLEDDAFLDCTALKTVAMPDRFASRKAGIFGAKVTASFTMTPTGPVTIGTKKSTPAPPPVNFGDFVSDGVTLQKYKGGATSVTVPGSFRHIGREAFMENKSIRTVVLSEGVQTIGYGAFLRSGLTSITLPSSLESIETHAFGGCFSLAAITLPGRLKSINSYAFHYCNRLTDITIPDSVEVIQDNAFQSCTALRHVTIPARFCDRVAAIFGKEKSESIAFTYTGATPAPAPAKKPTPQIDLGGATIESLFGTKPAAPTPAPTATPTPADLAAVLAGAKDMRVENGTLVECRNETATELTVPDGVTRIGKDAFTGLRSLRRLTLLDGVETIDEFAFFCCLSLEELILPESVTKIGDDALTGCRSLKAITLPAAMLPRLTKLLGASAVKKLKITPLGELPEAAPKPKPKPPQSPKAPVTFPPEFSVKGGVLEHYLGNGGEVEIPDGVRAISGDAFPSGCLVTSITLPASVTEIEEAAFADLPRLAVIRVAEDNAVYCAVNGALYTKGMDTLVQYPVANRNTSYTAPEGTCRVATGAFYGCRELHYVTLGPAVTAVGGCAFYGCLHLSRVQMSATEVLLGEEAFGECPHLLEVELPEKSRAYVPTAFGDMADSDIFRFH